MRTRSRSFTGVRTLPSVHGQSHLVPPVHDRNLLKMERQTAAVGFYTVLLLIFDSSACHYSIKCVNKYRLLTEQINKL